MSRERKEQAPVPARRAARLGRPYRGATLPSRSAEGAAAGGSPGQARPAAAAASSPGRGGGAGAAAQRCPSVGASVGAGGRAGAGWAEEG